MTAVTVAPPSPNLALNQLVDQRRAAGDHLVHLAFGEARLPVLPQLTAQLAAGAARSAYGPVAGAQDVRDAVAGYFTRRRLPTDADRVVVAPGSKPLLMALQLVIPGDVLLPRPAWNTYAPQAEYAGKRVFGVPIPAECGGVPDPGVLRATIRRARAAGGDPRLLVLTLPDNPTGTLAPPPVIRELCAVAEAEDLLIVSDEIYRDIVHDPDTTPFLSPAEVAPERTVVTTGLSKTLGVGGWRIGAARFPEGDTGALLRDAVVSAASELWSTLAGPMQQVARYAFEEPPEIVERMRASARLHGAVARAVHRIAVDAGATAARPPAGSTSTRTSSRCAAGWPGGASRTRRPSRPVSSTTRGSSCWPATCWATTRGRCASRPRPACCTETRGSRRRPCTRTTRRVCRTSRAN